MPERKPSAPAEPAPLTIEQILEQHKPRTLDVPIPIDTTCTPPRIVVFKLRTVGRTGWEKILDDHPATDEQQAAHKQMQIEDGVSPLLASSLRWNTDTFPPALIAASCVEPAMTVQQAQAMWDDPDWDAPALADLFNGALSVNDPQTIRRASLGKD